MPLYSPHWMSSAWKSDWTIHSARTAVAAALALAAANQIRMPEAYWAPISTIVVMQSTLGASWIVSKRRLIGTALGALLGGILAVYAEPRLTTFAAGTFVLGLTCAVLRQDQSAYRFAGVAYAITVLAPREEPLSLIGVHRFVEVSIGIAAGLVVSAVWPGRAPAQGRP